MSPKFDPGRPHAGRPYSSPLPKEYFEGLDLGGSAWDAEVDELRELAVYEAADPDIRARSQWVWGDQLVFGQSPLSSQHYYLPFRALLNGLLVEGRSEAGKSARLLDPLAAQVIANPGVPKVLFITFKESRPSFANCAIESARAGRRFRWVTTMAGKHTFGLPLVHTLFEHLPFALRRASGLVDGLGLNYGRGYGKDFFRSVQRRLIASSTAGQPLSPDQQTFDGLARLVAGYAPHKGAEEDLRRGQTDLMMKLFSMAEFVDINCRPTDDRALIDLAQFFLSDTRECLYVEAVSEQNPDVAYTLVQFLLHLGADVTTALPETSDVRVAVFVDEAAEVISDGMAHMIQRLRARGFFFGFAYQHRGQFEQHNRSFALDFEGYASTKVYLSVEDVERAEFFRYMAGVEEKVTGTSYRVAHDADPFGGDLSPVGNLPDDHYPLTTIEQTTVRNVIREARGVTLGILPRLSVNDIFALFAQDGYGLVRSSRDRDLWQQSGLMIPTFFPFHITAAEYARRRALPWPSPPGTKPATYTDAYAAFVAETAKKEPTVTQGKGWKNLIDEHNRRQKPPQ